MSTFYAVTRWIILFPVALLAGAVLNAIPVRIVIAVKKLGDQFFQSRAKTKIPMIGPDLSLAKDL